MKKRIGTKLYDTETSEKFADVGVGILYRKRTRKHEYFLLIGGDHIEPLTDKEAQVLLGEDVRISKVFDSDSVMIRVDRDTHAKIAERADKEGLSITKYMRKLIESL